MKLADPATYSALCYTPEAPKPEGGWPLLLVLPGAGRNDKEGAAGQGCSKPSSDDQGAAFFNVGLAALFVVLAKAQGDQLFSGSLLDGAFALPVNCQRMLCIRAHVQQCYTPVRLVSLLEIACLSTYPMNTFISAEVRSCMPRDDRTPGTWPTRAGSTGVCRPASSRAELPHRSWR